MGMSKPPKGSEGRCKCKMKKKYDLKLKDMLITKCCIPRTFLGIQTVDGLFSDSSGVLMKYYIQPVDPRVLYNN